MRFRLVRLAGYLSVLTILALASPAAKADGITDTLAVFNSSNQIIQSYGSITENEGLTTPGTVYSFTNSNLQAALNGTGAYGNFVGVIGPGGNAVTGPFYYLFGIVITGFNGSTPIYGLGFETADGGDLPDAYTYADFFDNYATPTTIYNDQQNPAAPGTSLFLVSSLGSSGDYVGLEVTVVPEPASMTLLGCGFLGLVAFRAVRRRKGRA